MSGPVPWLGALLGGECAPSFPARLTTTRLHDRAECASLDGVPEFNMAATHT
jgi:hypothetical protein